MPKQLSATEGSAQLTATQDQQPCRGQSTLSSYGWVLRVHMPCPAPQQLAMLSTKSRGLLKEKKKKLIAPRGKKHSFLKRCFLPIIVIKAEPSPGCKSWWVLHHWLHMFDAPEKPKARFPSRRHLWLPFQSGWKISAMIQTCSRMLDTQRRVSIIKLLVTGMFSIIKTF